MLKLSNYFTTVTTKIDLDIKQWQNNMAIEFTLLLV